MPDTLCGVYYFQLQKMVGSFFEMLCVFLISQPLIYLIEVPFEPLGWGIFIYYKPWFIQTLLVLPGAAPAFLIKKKNLLSVFVLSVATGGLAYLCVLYIRSTIGNFPHHLLSAVFCFITAVLFVFIFLEKKSHRVIALLISAAIFVAAFILTGVNKYADNSQKSLNISQKFTPC